MNYDLAKELKDAGFPQDGDKGTVHHINVHGLPQEAIYHPTLEELIEACGERFKQLIYWPWAERGKRWTADMWPFDSEQVPQPKGSTPTEAVARLWLALNRKEA